MATIDIDGVRYEVREGSNLLHACLSQGLDLPYFCWHPSLGSVGACRQCAVVQYEDDEDATGKLTMACMTPASDGDRVSIAAEQAVQFRASVIEWLMLNHPHDCPVCEEGGECHLQDMTVMTGHTFRRYRGAKRTWRNQYLGPLINHEMNRCITCYRCVRFYRDYAGGSDLDAFGSRDRLFFGRAEDGVLESEFAGNLVEVCPTGVFTDKPFSATYTRKWDLTSAPSVCHGCSVGCNTLPGERYGRLKRVHNRYHDEINRYFLCDRGRFGADFVNSEARLRRAGRRRDGSGSADAGDDAVFDELTEDEAVQQGAALLGNRVVGIGSPRASMESNFLLQRLVGREQYCPGFAVHEAQTLAAVSRALDTRGVAVPTLREMEQADAVLVLGEDVSNSAPRLALALRQTVRNLSFELAADAGIPAWQDAGVRGHAGHRLTPLFQATVLPTRLDDVSERTCHGAPEDLARLGHAVANALDPDNPAPEGLTDEQRRFADAVASALKDAERPLVVSGAGCGVPAVMDAARAVAASLRGGGREPALSVVAAECNAVGAWALGGGLELDAVLTAAERGEVDTLVVLENDLSRRADRERLRRALQQVRLLVLDCYQSWTAAHADLVLPAATFAESDGTWINHEGRAQRFFRVFPPPAPVTSGWRWLVRLAGAAGGEMAERAGRFEHQGDIAAALAAERDELHGLAEASPDLATRSRAGSRVPRQPHRYSGRTAMHADRSVHEPMPPADEASPLTFSMEGLQPREPGGLLTFAWSPGWNSNQSVYKFQSEVGGPLRGGPSGVRLPIAGAGRAASIPEGTVADSGSAGMTAVLLQDVFASDELSAMAAALAQRAAAPCAVLAPADAERLGVAAGDGVRCEADGAGASLVARLEPDMAPGAVGLVRGTTGALFVTPGMPVTVTADPTHTPPGNGVIARG